MFSNNIFFFLYILFKNMYAHNEPKVNSKIPMNRMANKDEYKGSIIYLLSDASSYVNGAVIAADGGRSAW